jgi:cephalosporin hydroxylase
LFSGKILKHSPSKLLLFVVASIALHIAVLSSWHFTRPPTIIQDDVLVVLDSNHTHEHVLEELKIWSKVLKPGNFMIISDTVVEDIPKQLERPRPWGPGNNPGTALKEFLLENEGFSADNEFNKKTFATFNPGGYIQKV